MNETEKLSDDVLSFEDAVQLAIQMRDNVLSGVIVHPISIERLCCAMIKHAEATIQSAQPASEQKPIAWARADTLHNWQGQIMNVARMFPSPKGLLNLVALYTAPPATPTPSPCRTPTLTLCRHLQRQEGSRLVQPQRLGQQLATAQAEIGQIKLSWKQRDNEVGVLFNESLHQQLAAAQATNKALRESLQTFADVHGYVGKSDVTDAINLSNDDTALRAELAKVYEECAAECDNRAEKERAKAKIRRDCKEIAHAQMYDQNAEAAMLMARYLRDLAKRKLEQ